MCVLLCAEAIHAAVLCADDDAAIGHGGRSGDGRADFVSPALASVRERDAVESAIPRADDDRVAADHGRTFDLAARLESPHAFARGAIIVGSGDGRLYCVALADGKERWAYEIGAPVTASPAVADGRIVVGAEDGSVYCFGAK